MIVYNSEGLILCSINPEPENVDLFLTSFNGNVNYISNEFVDINKYKVLNKKLVKLTDIEMNELFSDGRFLTEEERMLESMKPSMEEVRDAEQTIKWLSLLEEVL